MSKVIDEQLMNTLQKIEVFPSGVNYKPAVEALKTLVATELVRMMEEALPNKKSWKEDVGFDYSLKEMNAHNQAIDQTRTRLTAIIERELG